MGTFLISDAGNQIYLNPPKGNVARKIPAAVYIVKQDEDKNYFLEKDSDGHELPKKLYGTANARVKKVMDAFGYVKGNLGVLLTGGKGTGKTLLTDAISNECIKTGVPVVVVRDTFTDTGFLKFIKDLGRICLVFDEFEKTYSQREQNELLTLFDGMFATDRLVLLTGNDGFAISPLYINRPSRILFYWKYGLLEDDVVKGYCKENLKSKKYTDNILSIHSSTPTFNFDSLKQLVSECNRMNGKPFKEITDGLNIDTGNVTDVELVKIDSKLEIVSPQIAKNGHDSFALRYSYKNAEGGLESGKVYFNSQQLIEFKDGIYIYEIQIHVNQSTIGAPNIGRGPVTLVLHIKLNEVRQVQPGAGGNRPRFMR